MQRHITRLGKLLGRRRATAAASTAVSPQHQDMPDCRRSPFLETLTSILDFDRGKRLHEFIDERHRRYGPVFRGGIGPLQAVFVSSPEAIQQVFLHEGKFPHHFVPEAWILYNKMRKRKRGLLFMDDQEWHHYRKILNKVMLDKSVASFMSKPCEEGAQNLADKWKDYMIKDQTVPDLENQLYQWSIEVVLATMVGDSWSGYRHRILPRLETLSRRLGQIFDHSVHLAKVPAQLAMRARLPSWRGFVAAADEALQAVDNIVEEMAELEGADDGMLLRMMDAGIERSMLQRIVGDLIVAAGDTTAYSMQWLLFLLASNLECQEKIADKLRGLSSDEVLQEPLLKGAIKESLRLYPIAPFLTRILPEDILLDGYPAHKGELVVISFYSSSRDESNFPEPNSFVPERWLKNEKGESLGVINHRASLPFAMGARSCIGKKLAEIQMSLTTAELLKHYVIDCLNKHNVTLKLRLISAPSEPLQLRLIPRS